MKYSRFESLGDNCELGFVLRSLGSDEGGLFKWARLEIDNLNKVLQNNLQEIFEYRNLSPLRTSMVYESTYGIGWHSRLTSEVSQGGLIYVDNEATRIKIHQLELKNSTI